MTTIRRTIAILALLTLPMALCCPAADDDDSADDDGAVDPLAPVLSELKLQQATDGSGGCNVFVKWHVEDDDGDLEFCEVFIAFDDTKYGWNYELSGGGEIYSYDFSVDVPVGGVMGQPHVDAGKEYDQVEVWMKDRAERESNHLIEEDWEAPTEDCI